MLQLWFVANTILWPFILNLGGLQLGLSVIVLTISGAVWLGNRRKVTVTSATIVAALLAYLVFSLLVAVSGPCTDKFSKLLITGPILAFLALIGFEAGRKATTSDWLDLQKTATWILLAAFSGFILEMAVPSLFPHQAGYRSEGKLSGLFMEPSTVAFSLFPCVAVLLVAESKKIRRRGYLAVLGLLLFSRSSTLLAFIVVWILYRLFSQRRLRQAGVLVFGMASLVILGSAINYDLLIRPTVARVVGVAAPGDTENTSSLVYLQGWQDAWVNIVRTHGLGLGFNMMGCHPLPDVPARTILALEGLEELNAQDGSILFGKIVSEAGVGGIVFYSAIIWWWVRLEKRIRAAEDGAGRLAASTQAALIFCFVTSSFIRSVGYFSGGMLLWIAAVSGALKWQQDPALKLRVALNSPPAKTHRDI
jgi:hypothetical protein